METTYCTYIYIYIKMKDTIWECFIQNKNTVVTVGAHSVYGVIARIKTIYIFYLISSISFNS